MTPPPQLAEPAGHPLDFFVFESDSFSVPLLGELFTALELRTARLVAQGRVNKDIEAECHMGRNVAKQYVHRILRKTGCRNRTELAVWFAQYEDAPPDSAVAAHLYPHETGVARLVAQGKRNSEIAEALGLTTATVKQYLHLIMRKTHCATRTQLALWFRATAA